MLLIGASWLAACGQGAPVSSAQTPSGTAPGSSTPATAALKMTGTPAASVVAGNLYTFQPTVTESSGTVTFSVTGSPAWATFNSATGELAGTPSSADVGTTAPIEIVASDGSSSASIGPFTITVDAATAPTGSATLSWVAPTQNTDGSALTDLAGYIIHYGTSADALTQTIAVSSATTTYVVDQLAAGTYYFAVVAYTSGGTQSAPSSVASKTI